MTLAFLMLTPPDITLESGDGFQVHMHSRLARKVSPYFDTIMQEGFTESGERPYFDTTTER